MSLNDVDIDTALLRQFRTMGTADKDVLVCHFRNLLGNNISTDICNFYLEMNDWNLQAAISSYFDYELDSVTSSAISYSMVLTFQSTNVYTLAPLSVATHTWLITNNGSTKWPIGCHVKHMSGESLTTQNRIMINPLEPGENQEISIDIRCPPTITCTYHRCVWRLCTFGGVPFGDTLTIEINAVESSEMSEELNTLDNDQAVYSNNQFSIPPTPSDPDSNDVDMS